MQRQERPLSTIQNSLTNIELLLSVLIETIKAQTATLAAHHKDQLDVQGACMYLGLSRRQLYKLTGSHILPYTRPGGKKMYFQRQDLDDYMGRNTIDSAGQIDAEAIARFVTLQRSGRPRPRGS